MQLKLAEYNFINPSEVTTIKMEDKQCIHRYIRPKITISKINKLKIDEVTAIVICDDCGKEVPEIKISVNGK